MKIIGEKTMANIDIKDISDLNLDGNDLFQDSESFITELSNDVEQDSIIGGCATSQQCCYSCHSASPVYG